MTPQVQTLPSAGNLLASLSLAASATVAVLFNNLTAGLSGSNYPFSWDVVVRETTGSTAASTSGVSVSLYNVVASTTINNSGGYSSGVTSIVVASATGIFKGMKIGIDSGATGEVVTVSAISGTTLTVSTTLYAHANGAGVYLIPQTAPVVGATLGQNLTAANTTYSESFLDLSGNKDWYLVCSNTDASNAVTLDVTARATTAVQ